MSYNCDRCRKKRCRCQEFSYGYSGYAPCPPRPLYCPPPLPPCLPPAPYPIPPVNCITNPYNGNFQINGSLILDPPMNGIVIEAFDALNSIVFAVDTGAKKLSVGSGYTIGSISGTLNLSGSPINVNGNLNMDSSGIYPTTINSLSVGTSSNPFNAVYATTLYGTNSPLLSDRRLINKISENLPGRNFVDKLRFVSFEYNNKPNKITHGLIAQEVEEVIENEKVEFPGLFKPDSESEFYSIDYNKLIPIFGKAIQTLSAENKELRSRIEKLEEKLAEKF